MAAIWSSDGSGWRLLAPTGFPDEATLHKMVEQAPQMLPLAGTPNLVIVGREVQLGGGYADLIAVEPSGRLVIIEVKLARNAEARRAVVAQVLTYAAFLRGMEPSALEQQILRRHLAERDYSDLAKAVETSDQTGEFDADTFTGGLTESLSQGSFRLVVVLDEAPEELVRLVGYLEAVTDKLLIDLISVSTYEINGSRIIVPQRVEAEQQRSAPSPPPAAARSEGRIVAGADDFIAAIEEASEEERPNLRRLADWAVSLEAEGLATLGTYQGVMRGTTRRWTLLPRLRADGVGLVTIWNERGGYIQLWRSVFERRAPASLPNVESLVAPAKVGQGTTTRAVSEELLAALTAAYREAASGTIVP